VPPARTCEPDRQGAQPHTGTGFPGPAGDRSHPKEPPASPAIRPCCRGGPKRGETTGESMQARGKQPGSRLQKRTPDTGLTRNTPTAGPVPINRGSHDKDDSAVREYSSANDPDRGKRTSSQTQKKVFSVMQEVFGVRRYRAALPGGRETDPDEYVPSRAYEPPTVRGESERSGNTPGATGPADPAHI
jgi:hypothetical protein